MNQSDFHYSVEDISPVEKRIHMEVSAPHLQKTLDNSYRNLAKEASIPGFRKGKAPRSLLEQYFKNQVESDVVVQLVEEGLTHLIEKTQMRMASQPILEKKPIISAQEPLRYDIRIEIYPDVDLKRYEGFELTKRQALVTETDIEQEVEKRRNQFLQLNPIENREILAATDIVTISAAGSIAGKPYNQKEIWVDLSAPERAPLPGLAQALLGLSITEKKHSLSFLMPQEGIAAELIGQPVSLEITLIGYYQKYLPALDDEFAKDTGEAETLAEFKEKMRAFLLAADEKRIERELQEMLIDELIQHNPVSLPPSLIRKVAEDYLEHRRTDLSFQAMKKQMKPEEITPQTLWQIAESLATRDLSFQFLIRPLAEKGHIEVTPADMENRLVEWAKQEQIPTAKLKAELQRRDPELRNVEAQILSEKVLDWTLSHAKITQKEVESI